MKVLVERLSALAEEAARPLGLELDDLELLGSKHNSLLRVTIDKSGGITLDDCEAMSRGFEALLDIENAIESRYTIEVSSPGLDRELKKPRHFEKSIGRRVKVVLKEKREGQGFVMGRIEAFGGGTLRVALDDGNMVDIPLEGIKKARLQVEL